MKRFYKIMMCFLGSIIVIFLAKQIQDETNDIEIKIKQIKNGDFSNLKESEDELSEQIKSVFARHQETQGIDWIELDINGDNINELIWQETENYNENMKRIIGIFSFQLDGVTCVLWDVIDHMEYYFLSRNGNIIYYTQYYGTFHYNGYEHFQVDKEGNMNFADGLYIYDIYNFSEVDVAWWYEEHPDMLSEGIYYKKHSIEPGEMERIEDNLDEEDFLKAFEEMTGNSFDNIKPEWMTGYDGKLQDKSSPVDSLDNEVENSKLLDDIVTIDKNPFFFKEDVHKANYNARFNFSELDLPNEVELLIAEVLSYENGIMYELKVNYNEDFSGRYYYDWDRLHLGYFYVQKDKIYLIREQSVLNNIKTEADIINNGIIVCQEEEMKDALDEDESGWHEYILVNGNRCEYHSYNSLAETGLYEIFIWEQGNGLVEYKCGFGAEKDDLELSLKSY